MANINLLYIDLFCGAGGTTSGVEYARVDGEKCAKVVACVNHDANAILSHKANHPDALHFTEDICTLELSPMVEHLHRMKNVYPGAYVVLWASLECTNFSRAKGGQPRDADSRTLAEHLYRYIEHLKPDYIQIENVEEFMCWGELDENGHPVSKRKGSSYMRWVKCVCQYGYDYDWRLLNAADFGAYTSRRRFFGQFAKKGLPIAFPKQTHTKAAITDKISLFPCQLQPWKPVRDVLDLQDEGSSIFTKKKPLCEKTLQRIYAGLVKFVAGGKEQAEAWILKYNSTNQGGHHNPPSIDEPCPVVAVQNRLGVVRVSYLSKQFSGEPGSKNITIDGPAGTITTIDHHALVSARFLDMQYGNGTPSSVERPAPTATTNPKYQLVTADHWLMDTSFNNFGSSIEEPSKVITANRKWHYLMNPQFASKGGSVNSPCFTLIARMDKMPPYLISTDEGVGIEVYENDSPMTVKIKEFMAAYGIYDIKMRMLKISELKRIMGFPDDYTLIGTQAEQKKFIGNAVEVNMSRVLCETLCKKLNQKKQAV